MRNRLFSFATLSVLVLLNMNASATAQRFPMQVYVAERSAMVRGGPGEAYYATLELGQGEELTAYRLDGDWYAVRPPRGSFSLVSANAISDRGDGTGEVVRQGAASRLGSSIVDMQDTVHVRLEKGESVRILGSQMREGVKWVRIEPPHGEFRWVHRGDVSTTPIEVIDRLGATGSASASEAVGSHRESTGRASGTPGAAVLPMAHNGSDRYGAPPLANDADATWETSKEAAKPLPPPNANNGSPPAAAAVTPPGATGSASAMPLTNSAAQSLGSTGGASGTPLGNAVTSKSEDCHVAVGPFGKSAAPAPVTADDFARQLFVLEVELGRIVADSPERWNLGGMEQEARRLLTSAQTEEQRKSAQALAARLDRFAAIRRQYELLPSTDTILAARPTNRAHGSGTHATTTVAQSVSDAAGNSNGGSRYDAMGMLRPVASKRADAPKYALVNEAGQIITFVTPAPDVNLQPYLGRVVGVNGTRGYMAEFNHRHVTAGRVMPVNDRVMR